MDNHDPLIAKNIRTGLIVLAVVVGMIGLSFAAVPLFRVFCKATGFAGTTRESKTLPAEILARTVTIRFNADTDPNLPWTFRPEMKEVSVKLGARGLATYQAYNPTAKTITGTAVYNVTPLKAGKYFNKIQCFCFGEQTLKGGQTAELPVIFFVDPAMNKDSNLDDVDTITLSYTFYKAGSKELEQAAFGTYNAKTP